jgi:WD40 repeat protein/tRNA A-37 threonylcarbamoyl transferase component Bud32
MPAPIGPESSVDPPTQPSAPRSNSPDTLLEALAQHPRYEIIQLLGRGGMGAVYLARHKVMDRSVALKVISPQYLDNPQAVARFRREVQSAAKLAHPHIVTAHDAEQAGDLHFLVMEYVEGTDLARLLKQQGPLPVAEACEYTRQAALGLQHAFEHGLTHRDIKPHNLMLTAQGVVKVLDFGLARLVRPGASASELTGENVVMGTMDYIAPEQAQDSRTADTRSDIYSLGCTLFHLLTGQPPFPVGGAVEKVLAHVMMPPPLVTDLRPEAPAELNAVVAKMLAKEPPERYQTPADVAEALAPFAKAAAGSAIVRPPLAPPVAAAGAPTLAFGSLATEAVSAANRQATVAAPAPRLRRRGPHRLLVALGVLLLLGAGVAVWLTTRHGQAPGVAELPRTATPPDERPPQPPSDPPAPEPAQSQPMGPCALVGNPAPLAGLRGWTIETRLPRSGFHGLAYDPKTGRLAMGSGEGAIRVWDPASGRLLLVLLGHQREITSLAWSPDGATLATTSEDGTTRLWDPMLGRLLRMLSENQGPISSVSWSPDGTQLATGGRAGPIRVWRVADGQPIKQLKGLAFNVRSIVWSPEGSQIAAWGGRDRVCIWNAASGDVSRQLDTATHVGWSPDGKRFATSQGPNLQVRELADGKVVWQVKADSYYLMSLAWSPDGKRLACGAHDGATVKIFEAEVGKQLWRQGMGGDVAVAWSPDSNMVAAGTHSGSQVQLRDAATGKLLRDFVAHGTPGDTAALAPDGKLLAVSHWPGEVRIWEPAMGKTMRRLSMKEWGANQPAWSPDGKRLAACIPPADFIQVWDSANWSQALRIPPKNRGGRWVAWSPDEKLIAAGSGSTVDIYRADSGEAIATLGEPKSHCFGAAWSRDGALLAMGSSERGQELRLWDAATGKVRTLAAGQGEVRALAFSRDGKFLATGGHAGRVTVRIWALPSGDLIQEMKAQGGPITGLAWAPDGKTLASWGDEAVVRLVDPATGLPVRQLSGHAGGVNRAAWSPDSHVLATLSGGDLRLWKAASGRGLHTLPAAAPDHNLGGGNLQPAYLQWTPDGRMVLTRRRDSAVCCWSPAAGRLLRVLVNLSDGRGVAISAAGHYSASGNIEDELVYVVQTDQGQFTLTPAEFGKQYHWQNEPGDVGRLPDA